jgi:outer membrane protein OmpA-like peptidoglycan-associated protein
MSRPTRVWTGIAALTLFSVACFTDIAPKIESQLETRTAKARLTRFLETNSIMFSRGRVKLLPGSMRMLDSVASFVSELPEVSLLIEGHAYAHDDPAVNQALSEYCAEAVRVHLALRGVSADRIRIAGPETVRSPDAHDTGQAAEPHIVVQVE